MSTAEVVEELLARGVSDWLTAAELAWVVQCANGGSTDDEIMATSLSVLEAVVDQGLMEVGDVGDGGFVAWSLDRDNVLRRVEQEWRALGRRPRIGEVCWLANTPEGDRRAGEGSGGGII